MVNSAAFDITPYAMPSVPSTNCATKPIAGSSTNSVLIRFPLSPHSVTLSSTKRSRRPLDPAAHFAMPRRTVRRAGARRAIGR